MQIYVMLLSSNTRAKNFHENQYNEACFVKPDVKEPNETRDFAFQHFEQPYDADDGTNIKKESIIFILMKGMFESTIRKMELAVALPSLLLDPELPTILTSDEINVINDIFQCNNEICSKCLPGSKLAENKVPTMNANSAAFGYISASKFDRAVCETLKTLEKHIDVLRASPRYKCISLPSALFLHHIRYLLEQYILYRMSLTPEQARTKELNYRKLWRSHKKSTEDIAAFTCVLEKQRTEHEEMLENVAKRHKKNVIAIDRINNKCNQDVTNLVNKYERKQLMLYKAWELERKEIQLATDNAKDDLQALKRMNKELKRDVYERRSAIESELLAVINKYDTEIGGRLRILEELTEIYEHDKSERDALEDEIKQQETTYATYVKRKEEAEWTRLFENLTTFQRERAAKLIQRWWRKVFRKKKAPKRKVKRKRT